MSGASCSYWIHYFPSRRVKQPTWAEWLKKVLFTVLFRIALRGFSQRVNGPGRLERNVGIIVRGAGDGEMGILETIRQAASHSDFLSWATSR